MAGNTRFESSSTNSEPNFTGNYLNGQRGNHSGPNLDRPGSFREGVESRMFGPGVGLSRGSGTLAGDLPPLSQCLLLEPIMMGDQKYTRSGEFRRAMGFSVGSSSEDNSFGAAHLKPSPSVAVEELKRFRSSVVDTCIKARSRARKLDEHLHKLDKYCEAVTFKKQHRNEQMTNDRSGAFNLKMGTQISRNPQELVNQKVEDRPKNVLLNKRVRTSVAETRAECRSSGLQRQPLLIAKDRDLLKDTGGDSDLVEEKIRRLPAGGEGWDKRMKRKRSVGTVFTRPIDNDGELKRAVHHKVCSEPGLQSCDAHTSRLAASNVTGGSNKLDGTPLPVISSARTTPKSEPEGAGLPRELTAGSNKEKVLTKGSNKLNHREDHNATCPSPVTKGKASRTPRTSSIAAAGSSPVMPRVSGTLESWEHAPSANKIPSIGGAGNRKHAMSSGSSSPPMAQWVGQRPQKMSRTRRANLVSPVSNHDERQISSDGCSPSDLGVKLTSNGTNGSIFSRSAANASQQFKVKLENVQSPARLSESEESGGCEKRLKEKGLGSVEVDLIAIQNVGSPSAMITKKNKSLVNEEASDGVRRQGRSGRGSSISRSSISPTREKLDNATITKPLRSTRPGSEKNGSKSGRPLKKLMDRKGFSRLGHMQNNGSPDCTGESDDDREELLAAANFARNSSYLSCSSSFWKKMEPIYASLSLEDKSFLSQQLKCEENLPKSLSQIRGHENNVLGDILHEDISVSDTPSSEVINGHVQYQIESQESACVVESVEPLYQRVLSALIVEDDIEDFEENNVEQSMSLPNSICNSDYDTCLFIDAEPRKRGRMEFECDSVFGVQAQSHGTAKKSFSSTDSTNSHRSPSIKDTPCNDVHPEVELLAGISRNFRDSPQIIRTEGYGISSFDCPYEHMSLNDKILLELQSVDLYLETVPDLDDKEDDVINQEIVRLKTRLQQQLGKKKTCLEKTYKATGGDAKARELEQVAMDRLVELAYRKLLATRGTSKAGATKALKQVALAFARRTLARCQKFEDSGISCFSEPPLRDIIFAAPPRDNDTEPKSSSLSLAVASNRLLGSRNSQPDSRMSSGTFPSCADDGSSNAFGTFNHLSDVAFAINGPISNRGKKKEILLDDVVGSAALRATSHLGNTVLGGTKGKRSDRERDKDTSARNGVGKAGRTSQGGSKGDRKTKTKPKQKTAQLSTSGNGILSKFAGTTHPVYPSPSGSSQLANNGGNRKRDDRPVVHGNILQDSLKDRKEALESTNVPLQDVDPIDELGVSTDLGGADQDLSSLLNFDDDDGLQDHFSAGLDIPMDDLFELNMF